jgi:predicted peptidase
MKIKNRRFIFCIFIIIAFVLSGCEQDDSSDESIKVEEEITYAAEEKAYAETIWQEYVESVKNDVQRKDEFESMKMPFGDVEMKYEYFVIGEKPQDGYPLYIALHGGGQVAKESNDQQWEQMKSYYRGSVNQGIYAAIRGVRDLSNTHSQPESFPLYDRFIENMIAFQDVDPNRVYITGFSAGGDGVYQISPRMADRFAAANMSAGHFKYTSPENLYNLPVLLQMGENDTAYNRNVIVVEFARELEELQKQSNGGGYVYDIFIHKNKPHNFQDNDPKRQRHEVIANPFVWLDSNNRSSVLKNTNAIDFSINILAIHTRPKSFGILKHKLP